jgi:hypothetical protein
MLRELARIAAFFQRTEPHSPLSEILEEAVRRGRLRWSELLAEVMPDAAMRQQVLLHLGLRPAAGGAAPPAAAAPLPAAAPTAPPPATAAPAAAAAADRNERW